MASKRSLLGLSFCASVCATLGAPILASAGSFGPENQPLALTAAPAQVEQASKQKPAEELPLYLADAPAPEAPQIHGFFDSPFKTAYITPRGLVVEDKGLVWQPVGGLVFPLPEVAGIKDLSLVAGIWNSVNTAQGDPRVGAWNEMDVFVGFGGHITDQIKIDFDYEAWNFPNSSLAKPNTEHNLQLKVTFDDSKFWGKSGFAVNPYANFFYEVGGSSTVVLGRNGQTGYVELGIVPTYAIPSSGGITLAFPVYVSVGPKDYWGRNDSALTKPDGNVGVFSAGVTATIPLNFIPVKYGHWHAEAGLLYYYLANDALLRAGNLLSGNTDRSKFNGYVGVGVGF